MSIEDKMERIAVSLEALVALAANLETRPSAPASNRSKTKKTAEPTTSGDVPPTETKTVEPVVVKPEEQALADDWGDEFAEIPPPLNIAAKAKAEELKSFSDVKENFYEFLNAIRDSFGEKHADDGKAKAREIGYAILDKQIGTRTLNETTLPKDKFFDFTYTVEVTRADFFKS